MGTISAQHAEHRPPCGAEGKEEIWAPGLTVLCDFGSSIHLHCLSSPTPSWGNEIVIWLWWGFMDSLEDPRKCSQSRKKCTSVYSKKNFFFLNSWNLIIDPLGSTLEFIGPRLRASRLGHLKAIYSSCDCMNFWPNTYKHWNQVANWEELDWRQK